MSHAEPDSDADLSSVFNLVLARLKRHYRALPAILAIISVLVIVYVHFASPVYIAVAALTPPKNSLTQDQMGGGGAIGSITRRLGVGGPSSDSDGLFDEYARLLHSYRLAAALAKNGAFMQTAFGERWDPETRALRPRSGVVPTIIDTIKGTLGLNTVPASAEDQIFLFLGSNLSISVPVGAQTNISEVAFKYNNPGQAASMLDTVLAQADNLMRAEKRRDIAARIAYLNDQLSKITVEDQKTAMISLLMVQQNTMMTLAADHRYASNLVEPPHTPVKPSWPGLSSVIGLIIFLSAFAWGILIFVAPNGRILRAISLGRPRASVHYEDFGDQ